MQMRKQLLMLSFLATLSLTAYAFPGTKWSNDSTQTEKKEVTDKQLGDKDAKGDKKKEKETEYEKLLKDGGSTKEGLFTIRHIKDKWYFEIPDSLLGRYFLLVTRFTSVPQGFGKFGGEEVSKQTVYFEKRDAKTLLMRAYVLSQEADKNTRIYQTLSKNTVDPIVESFAIVQGNKNKEQSLVDVTAFFSKDNNITGLSKSSATLLRLGSLQSNKSYVDTIKTYPVNIEVSTTRTYSVNSSVVRASRTGYMTLGFNSSMVLLPKEPVRKRIWDKRVGYFVNDYTLFSDNQRKTDQRSFISRYHLVPKDVKRYLSGKLTEPVKPIVFYIDPATPKKWVPYLIKGINDWNVAFEAAGFKNAIMGKEWPNDSTMSLEDARYNVVRYLPSENENAYGPRIVDPRSGQIMEAHICWYHSVTNLLTKWYMIQCGPLDKRAQRMDFDDELMGQLIRFVSSHEVGHSLGLRHNMGASHATPVEKLRDKGWVEKHGHTVSIMDYARFNYVAQPEDGITEKGLFPRINDYDKWAIKWGYSYRPEFKNEEEEYEKMMDETTRILQKNPRLWFSGEGRDEDPRSQTEDLGDDNVKASEYGLKNLKRVIAGLPQWTQQSNDRYEHLAEMHKSVLQQFKRYTGHVTKNIGGRYLNNMPGKQPFQIAPAHKQKAALEYISEHVFDAPLWLYPLDIVSKTGINVQEDINERQKYVLDVLLTPTMLNAIYNDSFMSEQAYRLPDYLNHLFDAVWKPVGQAADLKANSRRALQRMYLENINKLINPDEKVLAQRSPFAYNSDAMLYVIHSLEQIETHLREQMSTSTGINALHYSDLLQQLKKIKERREKAK